MVCMVNSFLRTVVGTLQWALSSGYCTLVGCNVFNSSNDDHTCRLTSLSSWIVLLIFYALETSPSLDSMF